MKRIITVLILLITVLMASCSKVAIPNSSQAEEKLENLGYNVTIKVFYGEDAAVVGVTQMTQLTAEKDGDYFQAYFFANEEDTDTFYSAKATSLSKDVDVLKKNKYSIYRGSKSAEADFLS